MSGCGCGPREVLLEPAALDALIAAEATFSPGAGVSTDFLYSTPTLRSKITELRGIRSAPTSSSPVADDASRTSAIRALSTQLKEQRRRHCDELEALQKALAAAHGENLELRRRLSQLDD